MGKISAEVSDLEFNLHFRNDVLLLESRILIFSFQMVDKVLQIWGLREDDNINIFLCYFSHLYILFPRRILDYLSQCRLSLTLGKVYHGQLSRFWTVTCLGQVFRWLYKKKHVKWSVWKLAINGEGCFFSILFLCVPLINELIYMLIYRWAKPKYLVSELAIKSVVSLGRSWHPSA